MNCECRDYDDLRAALRQRAEELNISRMEINRVSGLPNGYSAAVLSETANKRLGAKTIGPLLAALGLKLVVVEDAEAMARYTARAEQRWPNMAHAGRLSRNAVNRAKLLIFAELRDARGGIAVWATKTRLNGGNGRARRRPSDGELMGGLPLGANADGEALCPLRAGQEHAQSYCGSEARGKATEARRKSARRKARAAETKVEQATKGTTSV